MLLGWLGPMAFAWTPETLQARLDGVAQYDGLRLSAMHPSIPPDAVKTLSKGNIATGLKDMPGQVAKIAWGVAVLDVPVSALFSAVNDDLNKPEYSKLSHVQLLEGEYCAERRLAFQFLPVPLITDRWWVIEQRRNRALRERSQGLLRELIWVKQADGTPLLDARAKAVASGGMQAAENSGGWWLLALDAKTTLIQFWALSDPGGSVPAGLVSQFAGGSIRDTFGRMETLAQRGPACSLE